MTKDDKKSEFTYNHARRLYRAAQKTPEELFSTLRSSYQGLNQKDVQERLKLFGTNNSAGRINVSSLQLLIKAIRNPINYLITGLGVASFITGNLRAAALMGTVVVFSVTLTFIQESRFKRVVKRLLAMSQVYVNVIRNYESTPRQRGQISSTDHEIPITELVPGDIVKISAGDIIPADIRLISAKNLMVNQSVLTGETIPVEKDAEFDDALLKNLPELKNVCFLGSSVVSGHGMAIVIHTGQEAYVSSIAKQLKPKDKTNFDMGAHNFVLRTLKFMFMLIPLVFAISLISKGNWTEALLFAITMTVSLTPKTLPLTISANLTKGALAMLKKRVIVKRLSAIQNLGSMDILCTDKTGTLTENYSVFGGAFNTFDKPDKEVLLYSYLNSFFQTGLSNHLDFALLKHGETADLTQEVRDYDYLDEIPFDSSRKRVSVLVKDKKGSSVLICKGALEEILPLCSSVHGESATETIEAGKSVSYISMAQKINELGLQAIAVGYKICPNHQTKCQISDEENLTLLGYVTFLDPPVKKDMSEAINVLKQHGVSVKILTGDNHWDALKIAKEIGLKSGKILLGPQIDSLSRQELKLAVDKSCVFAKLSPDHKQRIIMALQEAGHTVGFLGDGINDVPALCAADVGISVDNAVSTAKESSDIVLLEKSLLILIEGIVEGRKAFININKYIKISSVTKFGTVLSMLGASIFLPFLPLKPIQMLIQNLLFDFSQSGSPMDKIDKDQLLKPSKWEFSEIQRFRLSFGLVLALFDFMTFALMWFYFEVKSPGSQGVFQSAWLIESLVSQALIIHLLRSKKVPFLHVKAPSPSLITTILALVIGVCLPFSPLGGVLGFAPLPKSYFAWMIGLILSYCALTQLMKAWFMDKWSLRI